MYFHVFAVIFLLVTLGCGHKQNAETESIVASAESTTVITSGRESTLSSSIPDGLPQEVASNVKLRDVSAEHGLMFTYDNGDRGKALMTESIGGGAGWIDYNLDGQLDLFLVQGGVPDDEVPHPVGDQLFRSEQGFQFKDVTPFTGITDRLHGQGVAIGDFDDDGWDDVYVSNVGTNALWRNQGDGTFTNVTEQAGVGSPLWSTSACWIDLDQDGDMDLYVCNYLDYNVRQPIQCFDRSGRPAICQPNDLQAVPNVFYENLGNGQFADSTTSWGLDAPDGKSLGVVGADFDRNGQIDLYVANDVTANHLFMRQQDAVFQECAVQKGCAANEVGAFQASMGIACDDYDNNGFPDLYITHFSDDSNTLYHNLGHGFRDVTRRVGLHIPTLPLLGFGTVMCDFDADAQMDIFVANGHVNKTVGGQAIKMPPQLFTYREKRWEEVSGSGGSYFQERFLGRGVAVGDFDNSGSPDILVVHQLDQLALLSNESPRGHWLNVELRGRESNRHGIGATVELVCQQERWTKQLQAGGSYCSTNQARLFFGLGRTDGPCTVRVLWPSGKSTVHEISEIDKEVTLDEGES
jgi:enediyne biosynthesis protein E4